VKDKQISKKDILPNLAMQCSAIEQITCMVSDILDLAQISSGTFKLRPVVFEIRSLIKSIIHVLVNQTEAKGLSLKVKIEDDLPIKMQGDSQRLRQVLMNIIGNAIKFTLKGFIYIHLAVDKTYQNTNWKRIIFSIRDTGAGIS
jgi:signal transduction histidine kinase